MMKMMMMTLGVVVPLSLAQDEGIRGGVERTGFGVNM